MKRDHELPTPFVFLLFPKPPPTPPRFSRRKNRLSVRLLEAGAGAGTAKLLGLAPTVVGDEEGAVELDEGLLEQVLGVLVDELLVVGNEGLGDSLADSVDLRGVATARDADADVDVGELVEADNQEGLVDLVTILSIPFPSFSQMCSLQAKAPFPRVSTSLVCTFRGRGLGSSYLEAQDLGLDEGQRASVDLNETTTGLYCFEKSIVSQTIRLVFNFLKILSQQKRRQHLPRENEPCSGRRRWPSSSCRSIARSGTTT